MYKQVTKRWMKHVDFMLLDLMCLYLAYVFSYVVWDGRRQVPTANVYIQMIYVFAITSFCVAFLSDNHKNILHRGYLLELKSVLWQGIFVAAATSLYLFVTKTAGDFSRMTFGMCMVIYVLLMYLVRSIWKKVVLHIEANVQIPRAVLPVASSADALGMLAKMREKPMGPIRIVGFGLTDAQETADSVADVPVVARGESGILDRIQNDWVEEVLILGKVSGDFLEKCELMGVVVHQCLEFDKTASNVQIVENFCGYTVLTSCIQTASVVQAFGKRVIDILGALVGLLITCVLTIFIAPMIWIASPGPIFFSQVRVGCGGRRFRIYKFRSMYLDAEERKKDLMDKNEMQGLMFKMDADPRIIGSGPDGTRKGIGWFIRKTSIDEFPQFWNVLKGDMSLVGTRPPTLNEWEQYDYHHRSRLAIKPGITGLWQVSGRSDITDFEEVVRLDVEYICNWSMAEDIKILCKTVLVVLGGSGSK